MAVVIVENRREIALIERGKRLRISLCARHQRAFLLHSHCIPLSLS